MTKALTSTNAAGTKPSTRARSAMGKAAAPSRRAEQREAIPERVIVASLAALAQPTRLKVFRTLVVAGRTGLTPGAMAAMLDIAPNTVSFHLKELTYAGLVTQERASRNMIYRGEFERMNSLLAYLTENCCQGAFCSLDGSASSAC
jgi:ArsR family transcriptional regulator, arsenate/arsenite/antimonite-responsive transcriptional repressor